MFLNVISYSLCLSYQRCLRFRLPPPVWGLEANIHITVFKSVKQHQQVKNNSGTEKESENLSKRENKEEAEKSIDKETKNENHVQMKKESKTEN